MSVGGQLLPIHSVPQNSLLPLFLLHLPGPINPQMYSSSCLQIMVSSLDHSKLLMSAVGSRMGKATIWTKMGKTQCMSNPASCNCPSSSCNLQPQRLASNNLGRASRKPNRNA
jgi:hypothetical protein